MPIVYRVENEYGIGPYHTTDFANIFDHTDEDHPRPDSKFYYLDYDKLIFAFKTLKGLRKWFNFQERKYLKKFGFKIKKIKVKKISWKCKKTDQCAFNPKYSDCLMTYSIVRNIKQ